MKRKSNVSLIAALFVLVFGIGTHLALAQTSAAGQMSQSVLYVPLIGITSVPDPLALPEGPGAVVYHYAVKNFLSETALADIQVVDDKCSPVQFVEGDDNGDAKLDYSETWSYSCKTTLSATTRSVASASGHTNDITTTQKAYATVVVGSNIPPPIVSVVNVTKVAYPLALLAEGGDIVFTYRVSNPGMVPLNDVSVIDDKCSALSSKLGDTNGNNLLDTNEAWVYTCKAHLTKTTTNTVSVKAFANGLEAVGEATITVNVETPSFPEVGAVPGFPDQQPKPIPSFPETGISPNFKITVWSILLGVLAGLLAFGVSKLIKKQ